MTPTPAQMQVLQQYYANVQQHGPLPQNWQAMETGGYMSTKKECSQLYPMCPEARAADIKLEPRKYSGAYDVPGASNIPSYFGYAPADWIWTPGNAREVLYKALLYSKATNKEGNLVSLQDVDAEIKIAKLKTNLADVLYHPTNREEPLFDSEAIAAEVARNFQRSLWVLCPRLTEKSQWDAPWRAEPDHRPYIHLRFGPGVQGDHPPVVIGMLPALNKAPVAHWFFMQPCREWKAKWETLYVNSSFSVVDIANQLGFPKAPALYVQYALVACHRTLLLAPTSIDRENLARWISQYTEHLLWTHPSGAPQRALVPFQYGKTEPFKGVNDLKITPVQLDSWIIAAKRGSPLHVFSERWNRVMAARIRYTKSATLADWRALLTAQRAVTQLTASS